jgi:methyl-accepting chemotaxis protein
MKMLYIDANEIVNPTEKYMVASIKNEGNNMIQRIDEIISKTEEGAEQLGRIEESFKQHMQRQISLVKSISDTLSSIGEDVGKTIKNKSDGNR